ncbi:MAG TPA: glycoside hydrolase family 44 protein [Candidatus Acidoferrum sp.]|nr:glycoside hydrolase family 44 protein [Candidatus Acidoferrum sp.]
MKFFKPFSTIGNLLVAVLLPVGFAGCGGYGSGGTGGGGGGSAPAIVTGLAAAAANAQVNLTWNASAGATGYYVKRSTTSGAETQIAAQAGTTYGDTSVANGTKYFYVVAAYNSYGASADSNEVSATPAIPSLAAPSALTATPGDTEVALTWTAVPAATSYDVKRSTTVGAETQLAATTTNAFTDTGVTNGTKYYYVVTALNGATESGNSPEANATPAAVAANVTITVNPAVTKPISPYIYGTNFYGGNANAPALLTMDRAGGNRWTAYNWITNGSNAGSDYFYETDDYLCNGTCNAGIPAEAVRTIIAADQQAGLASLVTLQLQGYVSKDTALVKVQPPFPNLADFIPVADKKGSSFTLAPPDTTAYMDEFAWALDQKFAGKNIFGASASLPTFVSLDNEPELWNSTHAEIQGTTRVTSDAYISKTITLAEALKDQFPDMVIFGPVHYGFQGIYNWQGELSSTPTGTNWFPDKYLAAIKTASVSYGKPLVDVYDFHWYPEEYDSTGTRSINLNGTTLTAAQVQLIVQSPRVLWDATFNDAANGNSNPWIYQELGNAPINLLGRLQAKIDAENPGMKISITEYEGGGWNHIAGTIAEADYLGIFGEQGLFAASFWPPNGTSYDYAMAGFRAYRGFDGATGVFGDTSLEATSSNVANVVVYASADSTTAGHYVFVAINRSSASQVTAIDGVTLSGTANLYQITATSASGQNPIHPVLVGTQAVSGSSLKVNLPALSVTTIEVK